MTKQELFKQLCLSDNIDEAKLKAHKEKKATADELVLYWNIENKCISCKKEIKKEDFVIAYSYYLVENRSVWQPCHKKCKEEYEKRTAYECQKIDADCNDCKYFNRSKLIGKGVFEGTCNKFNKKVIGNQNFSSGNECFVHRLDNK